MSHRAARSTPRTAGTQSACGYVRGPAAVPPEDTLRMPAPELSSLLGRARDDEEPVFLLVRRRAPRLADATVSIVLFVVLVLGTAILSAFPALR